MKEEQLEKVREIALLYLHTPIEKTSSELVVSHPFTSSNIVASKDMRFLDLYVPSERQIYMGRANGRVDKEKFLGTNLCVFR